MCIRDRYIYLTSYILSQSGLRACQCGQPLLPSCSIHHDPIRLSSSIAAIWCFLNESSTVSLHLFRGLPLGLTHSGLYLHLLLATLSPCILSRCPHHLSLAASNLFIMGFTPTLSLTCLLYTSDAADERSSVDLGGRRIIKKKKSRS